MRYRKFSWLFALLLSLISFVNDGGAQASDPKIVEAAKKEGGEIEAYVTLRTDTAQFIWKMFEAKYPFLKVKQYKADSDKMLQRLATEYRAKKYLVDVLNFGGGFHTQVLIEHGIAGAYLSPETKFFAPAFKEKSGLWTTLYYNPLTLVYNTKLLAPNERPKDWVDLLHPRYKGRLAIEHEQVTWYAGMLKRYGARKGQAILCRAWPRMSRGPSNLRARQCAARRRRVCRLRRARSCGGDVQKERRAGGLDQESRSVGGPASDGADRQTAAPSQLSQAADRLYVVRASRRTIGQGTAASRTQQRGWARSGVQGDQR